MRFRINRQDNDEQIVDVWLEMDDDGETVKLMAGDWVIAKLYPDGTLSLASGIDPDNLEGLQVDTKKYDTIKLTKEPC